MLTSIFREDLTEQKALADEIGTAIASGPQTGEPIDEAELDADLAELEQEALDEKMLKTGTVPVLPGPANGESKLLPGLCHLKILHLADLALLTRSAYSQG